MTGSQWLDFSPLLIVWRRIAWLPAVLSVVVVVSAFGVTYVSHLNRQAFNQLQTELMRKNALQERWGQLLLQHSTETAHSRVEERARRELNMVMPDKKRVILVKP
ncbi:cell division protein FtsL [Parendozoicomonas sp. Alg238-R29]|uniref:cell division protein FtsL n=1 Tax=Parendozoicomonas sp. Alg238-R29 TaxID=2993446 RepID=UPI00248ED582|nr:cell division protein FtsL [Parendozoicomonas sp. Alg238-R29]